MRKKIANLIALLVFCFLFFSVHAQHRRSSKYIKDSIALMKWIVKNDSMVVINDSLTLENITKIKVPYSDENYLARINFVRRGNAIHTGCVIIIDSNYLSHVFRIESSQGSITLLSTYPTLDSSIKYTKDQLYEILETAKAIGSKQCKKIYDEPKLYLTMSGDKTQKAIFYRSCYYSYPDDLNTEFGKFIEKCTSLSVVEY